MNDERTEIIVKLQRLRAQVNNAIAYIESGSPLYPCNETMGRERETPNTFHIGDFSITDRFQEPRFHRE